MSSQHQHSEQHNEFGRVSISPLGSCCSLRMSLGAFLGVPLVPEEVLGGPWVVLGEVLGIPGRFQGGHSGGSWSFLVTTCVGSGLV